MDLDIVIKKLITTFNFNFMRKEKSKSSADFQQLSCFHKHNSYRNITEHILNNVKIYCLKRSIFKKK